SRLLQEYLDTVSIGADELTMPFHVWDALVATCVDRAAGAAEVPRDRGATVWVFVSLPSPTTTSAPYLTQAACEAARELLERSATTGCYREPFRTATSTSATFH